MCDLIHRQVLMQQQQKQIEEAVEKAQWDTVLKQAEENGLRLTEFDTILQPIIDSCTKDSISAGKRFETIFFLFELHTQFTLLIFLGKNYILQHTGDATKCNSIMQYLLKKYASMFLTIIFPRSEYKFQRVISFFVTELWSTVHRLRRSCI